MIQTQIAPANLLPAVLAAVTTVGALIRREFHRPGGPRTAASKALVDAEVEHLLKVRLLTLLPCGWQSRETATLASRDGWEWVVDPHNGASDFLAGHRGSAVSVALLRQSDPVLGVVHAPLWPHDGGEMIAWAEGANLSRNGRPVVPVAGFAEPVVAVGLSGLIEGSGLRALALPSPAFRLALASVGEVAAATSDINGLDVWEIAGGLALQKGAGMRVVDLRGQSIDLRHGAFSGIIGGDPAVIEKFLSDPPHQIVASARLGLPAVRVADADRLSKAQGCLLGLLAGDALGSQVEFQTVTEITARHPSGPPDLVDGGTWNLIAGQPTDDGEMALELASALLAAGGFDAQVVAAAYVGWRRSRPFDIGSTTSAGIAALARGGRPVSDSQANGALMRVAPIGMACAGDPVRAAAWATADAGLTHPSAVCRSASAAFAAAVAAGIAGADGATMADVAATHAEEAAVRACVIAARNVPPADYQRNMGWVLIALQNAFYHLLAGHALEPALITTVASGGDTDTNSAICGALLGATQGWTAVPLRWRNAVLTCRPGGPHPRPAQLWPDRALPVAEALLTLAQEK